MQVLGTRPSSEQVDAATAELAGARPGKQKAQATLLDETVNLVEELRILDQLVRTVPDGVFYTGLSTTDKLISINGIAESNNRVSSLMRRLDSSDWLAEPNLDKVRAEASFGDQATRFNLTVKVELPTAASQAGEG